ncbi:MAG: SusC/RagA family TonB-linked outer membrane protein [Marinifilaceae bacterium]
MKNKLNARAQLALSNGKMYLRYTLALSLLLLFSMAVEANTLKITTDLRNGTLETALKHLKNQSGVRLLFDSEIVKNIPYQGGSFKNTDLGDVLKHMLNGTELSYQEIDGVYVIRKNDTPQADVTARKIIGKVVDVNKQELPGVTVMIEGTKTGVTTDSKGNYTILCPQIRNLTLSFSFVGMKKKQVVVGNKTEIDVVLEEDMAEMDEVVVTGIYERKKESFTGSTQTFTGKDLKMIGNQNIIQSLKTLDPSFQIVEDNQYGSDPNRMPDIEIRGKSSIIGFKEEFGEDPNQPLFILDGFETSLEVIMNLSMDRIGSVTLLKDAASTAIYGSKAANGVVVVETKVPQQGRLRVSYNGDMQFSFADLTEYNLMNAAEKLEFERLSGVFESNVPTHDEMLKERYYRLLADVDRGVDSYWLSEPLRKAVTHKHSLNVEGGDSQVRYSLGVNYSDINGVMHNSDRELISGNANLIYRKSKISFSNRLTIDYQKTSNPIVDFSEYSRANPYYKKYTDDGLIDKWLEQPQPMDASNTQPLSIWVANPLWNDAQNSYKTGNSVGFRENLSLEYRPLTFLNVRIRGGFSKSTSEKEDFVSPSDSQYDQTDKLKQGAYSNYRTDSWSYNGDVSVTYGQVLRKVHQINAIFGANFNESQGKSKGFAALGFPEGNFITPSFANTYPENGKPSYSDYMKRSCSYYFNGGYSFDNRYLLDANLRSDGSSVFGSNQLFTTTWAVGLAWNVHNESFFKNTKAVTHMKIRASVGNPGNQNFGSYNTMTTYKFNNWIQNQFGVGMLVTAFGDPDLEWQKTIDKNIGFDVSLFDNRFHTNFDYYYKNTDPLMASIGVSSSTCVINRLSNVGSQITKGYAATIKYALLYNPSQRINWTTSLTLSHNEITYHDVANKLKQYNSKKSLMRYYDGGSPYDLWAVKSLGIDPATGNEIFLTADGYPTFTHSYDNEVIVGNSKPTLEGVIGSSLNYKGFNFNVYMRYSFGGEGFNSTLYEKVENISSESLRRNQDKRALYDRWQKPGDKAKFKAISLTSTTPISSRFVQKNDFLSIESVRLGYEFREELVKKIGLSGLSVSGYMSDIYRWGSIKTERGIDYPFARSFSFSLSANF